jgi:hypothetical protein
MHVVVLFGSVYVGCSTAWACILCRACTLPIGSVPISVEDCCLSVGVECVSRVLYDRATTLLELYSIKLLLKNPRIIVHNKKKIVHRSCVFCVPCGDDLLMIYC